MSPTSKQGKGKHSSCAPIVYFCWLCAGEAFVHELDLEKKVKVASYALKPFVKEHAKDIEEGLYKLG